MKKSLSPYAKTLYQWGKRNPNKIKKIIEDLYKKSFPNGEEDVIKFQSRYIDELRNFTKQTQKARKPWGFTINYQSFG